MTNDKLKVAYEFYLKKGWNIIPCNFKKAVLKKDGISKQVSFPFDYGIYHKEKVTPELAEQWWGKNNGMAVVTGEISGITVMDLDTKTLPEKIGIPKTFTVETNKGYHYYFKYTTAVHTAANSFKKGEVSFNIDIRNNGGIAFADPSEYELPDGTTARYKIIVNAPLAEFPVEWLENIYKIYGSQPGEKDLKKDWKNSILQPIDNNRNVTFTSIIGGLLQKFPQDDWNGVVWTLAQSENKAQTSPLDEHELRTIFNSIAKKELQKRNTGGEIKDISTEVSDDEIRISITLEQTIVCFKVKNISSSIMEGTVVTWIKKAQGLSHEIPFYFKLNSDSNKEQWARIMSRAFDKKAEKEVYPWILLVNKAGTEIEKIIREHKQDFKLNEIIAKDLTWMLEPFIQEDQINTFFGMGSSGKTMLSLYFASLVADQGVNTLFIDYENDAASWADKLNKMTSLKENFIYFDSEQIPLYDQVDKIKAVVKNHNIKLVIVDSASLASGDSTSDEKAALKMFAGLKLLRTTVVLIAHQRKNNGDGNPIGSIQYENQARNVWNFKSEPDNGEEAMIHVACKHTKANNTYLRKNPIGFRVTFGETIEIAREDVGNYFSDKLPISTQIERLLYDEGQMTYKQIAKMLTISDGAANKHLSEGKKRGMFIN